MEKYICPKCNKVLSSEKGLKNHLHIHDKPVDLKAKAHKLATNKSSCMKDIPEDVIYKYLTVLQEFNQLEKLFDGQFNSFYKMKTYCDNFEDSDIIFFFDKVLPWKLSHPNQVNNRELTKLIYPDDIIKEDKIYRHFMLEKNPYYQHDGSMSPFSKDFKGYQDLSDEEKAAAKRKACGYDNLDRNTNQVAYWIKHGYTQEEAEQKVKERQKTFTLEKCIEKYGEVDGLKRFNERQEKWLNNYKKLNYSKISQELFWEIYNHIKDQYKEIYFATLNPETKTLVNTDQNYEYLFRLHDKSFIKPDFYIKDLNLIIEFDGDYWHRETSNNTKRTINRDLLINNMGTALLHIKEIDFKNNKYDTIQKCLNFIEMRKNEIIRKNYS